MKENKKRPVIMQTKIQVEEKWEKSYHRAKKQLWNKRQESG